MSHAVKLTVELNMASELKMCNQTENELNNLDAEYQKLFENEIAVLKKDIAEMKTFASSLEGETVEAEKVLSYQKELDSLKKRLNNIKNINLSEYINRFGEKQSKELETIIAKEGVLATLAMAHLNGSNIVITSDSLLKEINKIRTEEANNEELKHIVSTIEETIFNNKFEEEIEAEFLEKLSTFKSPQLLNDLMAKIANTDIELERIEDLEKTSREILKDIQFKEISSNFKVTEKGEIEKIVTYQNNAKKRFKIFYAQDGMTYEMGNYEGHLCEKDSSEFIKLLQGKRKVLSQRIIRNYSNERPILRTMKFKERGK